MNAMDAAWYQDAIIYQLHVRSFYDSVGDGIGDFTGLSQKLDYLQDLGVTALWLMPFYPSPLRDDGYDIADYENINPQYGTLEAFQQFLAAAHERDLKVITELVINHTSDKHPWFQRARRAPPGSMERDFYVWSDTPEKYREARIIFQDFEVSNWTYDRVAKAYFWHRFYSHQPDLNYDNPAVRQAILPLLDFWFGMGVDGLRLDAVPYLFEREGTNCENLPETHAFLKELRRHVDARFPNRMLLAEANQWPEDAVAYFGEGDECHMAFHFPVMPRLFMAIHREDRFPIVDIMDQTPAIPSNCQWAMFLRNHDELTLEMVTDEERDYMYRAYAGDSQARINLGIRRRLAPLLSNNRRRIELMNGLLFSMPGTPVIYYGDEIGMGDNIYLGDRNGVRTPMQWSADRNAGFSRANPQKLFLPIIIDPEYHYEAINVEAQQNNPHSLLWWMKRLIDMRQRSHALSHGALEFLHPANRKVLSFLRRVDDETVLVVANLSRFVQCVELDLSAFAGQVPVEFFGGTRFPPVGKSPYFLTLGPHSLLWFRLSARPEPACLTGLQSALQLPHLMVQGPWQESILRDEEELEQALTAFYTCRLAPTHGEGAVKSIRLRDVPHLPLGGHNACLVLLDADLAIEEFHRYALPIQLASEGREEQIISTSAEAAIARVSGSVSGLLYDAAIDPDYATLMLQMVDGERRLPTRGGAEVVGWRLQALLPADQPPLTSPPTIAKTSAAHISYNFENRLVLRVLRQVQEGLHPEVEVGKFLRRGNVTCPAPRLLGGIEIRSRRAGPTTLAVVHEFLPNEGDAWQYTLDSLSDFFERVVTLDPATTPPALTDWFAPQDAPQTAPVAELLGEYLDAARLLGQRTAELHLALARDPDDPAFAPEPFSTLYQRSIYQSLRGQALQTFDELSRRLSTLDEVLRPAAEAILAQRGTVLQIARNIFGERIEATRIRCHGDFHLGQILFTGKDFAVIDFEGNARTALSERRIKRSPLRDVASMLQSFDYAARNALAGASAERGVAPGAIRATDLPRVSQWTRYWLTQVSAAYWESYRSQPGIDALLPVTPTGRQTLLQQFLLERSLIDVHHELRERPQWLGIALASLLDLIPRDPA
jgi:maltose alpha-D-glucosyltransferase/alpha-amylase